MNRHVRLAKRMLKNGAEALRKCRSIVIGIEGKRKPRVRMSINEQQTMRMKKIVLMAFAILMAVSGCKAGEQSESPVRTAAGSIVKENRAVGEFNGITLIGSYKVICSQGDSHSVVVEARKEVAEKLKTEVKDGMLTISREKIAGVQVVTNGKEDNRATVYVTLPQLQKLSLVGSGDIIVKDKITSNDKLQVSLSGSGDIVMGDVEVKSASFMLAGRGDVKAHNVLATQVELSLAGSGDVEVNGVEAEQAKFNLAGSGDVVVSEVKALNVAVNAAGSGDMTVGKVTCTLLNVNHASSSNVTISNMKSVTTNVNKVGSGDLKIAGTTSNYNEVKHGSGSIKKNDLIYSKSGQKVQNGGLNVSREDTPTSPNGIEAEP